MGSPGGGRVPSGERDRNSTGRSGSRRRGGGGGGGGRGYWIARIEQSNGRGGGGGDGRNMSPFPEEVSSKEPLPRKYFNKLLIE